MLALKIEYLTGVCVATRHNDPSRSTAEWPPHPDRLYSAMVAAAAEPKSGEDVEANAHISEAKRSALEWLAKQGAPHVAVSDARRRTAPDVHMPSNPHEDEVWQKAKKGKPRVPQKAFDLKSLLPVHRKKGGLPIPAVVPDEPVAYFVWPSSEPQGHLRVLRGICERVTYLGRSRSLVRLSLVENPPPATHEPDPLGQVQLRVPGPDRLRYLIEKYKRDGGKPEPCPPQRYRTVDGEPRTQQTPQSVFDASRVWLFKPQRGDPAMPPASTVNITRTFRAALMRCVEETGYSVPDMVHGHGKHPHCAYVALPFVHPWQRHADGTIKGLGVLVPRNPAEGALEALAAGLMRLQDNGLGIPDVGTWHLEEVPADDPPMLTLEVRVWTDPSRVWTTVTPMVFGHFPKEKNGGEGKVVLDSLRMIGIDPDSVLEIGVGRHSPLHGAPPSWCFKPQRHHGTKGQAPRHVRHVSVRFDRPVRGPIVLGCMRYFGLGLMRPMEE
jgi:CRISPR-associated protein Csb2